MPKNHIEYLDTAIELINWRLDELKDADHSRYEEEVNNLNKTYQLLVDLESGKRWILSLGDSQRTNEKENTYKPTQDTQ